MISIGAVFGGPELRDSAIDIAIRSAQKAIFDARGEFCSGGIPSINVVFHVSGSLSKPDWDGLRDAKFSKKQLLLMVQVAVPEDMNYNDKVIDYVVKSLRGANAIAFEFYRQKNMDYPLREAEKLVSEIKERLIERKDDIACAAEGKKHEQN